MYIIVEFLMLDIYRVRKLLNLRIWDDEKGKRWHYSVSQKKYEVKF